MLLTAPLFHFEQSGVGGTKRHPQPWRLSIHPSILDIGVGTGAIIAAYAAYSWAIGTGGPDNLIPKIQIPGTNVEAPIGPWLWNPWYWIARALAGK